MGHAKTQTAGNSSGFLTPKPSSSYHTHLLETQLIQNLSSPDKYATASLTVAEKSLHYFF